MALETDAQAGRMPGNERIRERENKMNKVWKKGLTLLLSVGMILSLAACSGKSAATEAPAEEGKPTATATLHLDNGNNAEVTVDLSGGCSVEFAYGAVYFYQPGVAISEYDDAAAYVYISDQEGFDSDVAEYSSYDSFEQTDDHTIVTQEDGSIRYYIPVDAEAGIYLMMTAGGDCDYMSIFNRFTAVAVVPE